MFIIIKHACADLFGVSLWVQGAGVSTVHKGAQVLSIKCDHIVVLRLVVFWYVSRFCVLTSVTYCVNTKVCECSAVLTRVSSSTLRYYSQKHSNKYSSPLLSSLLLHITGSNTEAFLWDSQSKQLDLTSFPREWVSVCVCAREREVVTQQPACMWAELFTINIWHDKWYRDKPKSQWLPGTLAAKP